MKISTQHSFLYFVLLLLLSASLSANSNKRPEGFIENKGQIMNQSYEANPDVLFLYSGKGINIQLRRSGYSYELYNAEQITVPHTGSCQNHRKGEAQQTTIHNYRVDVEFEGMNPHPEIVKEQQSTDYLNYYINDNNVTHVYSYGKITYKNVFRNIDIEFLLNAGQSERFKYNLILHPGANLNDIKFLINGAKEILADHTALTISTPLGAITENIPFSYYTDAPSANLPVTFKLHNNRLSFSAQHDPGRKLVIDPSSNLAWATYYGGSVFDYGTATGVDAQNNVYLGGHTMSTGNIATNGAFQTTYSGNKDAFLAKFNSAGVRQWATYFGGTSFEDIYNMHVEPNGNIYIVGDSDSPNGIASPGAHQTTYGGASFDADAILAKFDPSGLRLWSTYFGDNAHDLAQAITLDNSGNVIIGGHTKSISGIATPGVYSTTQSGLDDVFIAKFTPAGTLLWATYYGDSGDEEAFGLVCDAANNIYVTGWSWSLSGLATPGSHQQTMGGFIDGFIAKFNSTGTSLLWGTYYGGSGLDKATAIRLNNAGNLIISGNTASNNNIATPGSYQSAMGSADDAFLTCFTTSGTRLWGSYFGGNDVDYINGMILDNQSNIIVCGQTQSSVGIAAGNAPYQSTLSANYTYDAFFAKLSPNGTLQLGSYFGGAGNDNAWALAQDNTGKLYLAGETTSTANIATPAAHQTTIGNAAGDAYLAKFCITFHPLITTAGGGTVCIGTTSTLSALSGYSTYLWNNTYTVNPLLVTHTVQGSKYYSLVITDEYGCTGETDTVQVIVNNCVVSLDEPAESSAIRLFPVPSGNFIYLEGMSGGLNTIELYTLTGQLVSIAQTHASSYRSDISALAPGLYLARVKNMIGSYETKFIKE